MGIKTILKAILFIISTLGSWEYLDRKLKVDKHFLPSITIAIQTSVLFAAGLLNCLKGAAILLWAAGILLFAFYCFKDKRISFLRKYCTAGYFFLAVSMIALFLFLRGKIYAHWDNFTHWGLVLRLMLEENRFPNFKDYIIIFKEYPLGSATYLYYFAKLIRRTESFQMLGQCYMMLAAIMPVFCFLKKNRVIGTAVIFFCTNFFLTYNVVITNLLVDTLLPLVACCMFQYMFFYCRDLRNKEAYFAFFFYLVQLVQIKNSGLLFVAIAAVYLLHRARKEKTLVQACAGILLPAISFFLWHKHCSYVYEGSETSVHAMTLENYKNTLESKSAERILTISKNLFKYFFTFKETYIVIGLILCTLLLIRLFKKDLLKNSLRIIGFTALVYVLYCIGMWLMYIFSMPASEADRLAGNDRYMRTILIMAIYANLILCVQLISALNEKKVQAALAAASTMAFLAAQIYTAYGKFRTVFEFYGMSPARRIWLETKAEEYDVPWGDSYCILQPEDEHRDYTYYLSRYIFRSDDIDTLKITDKSQLDDVTEHYLFIYDEGNEIITEWIQENYPEQAGNSVIIQNVD